MLRLNNGWIQIIVGGSGEQANDDYLVSIKLDLNRVIPMLAFHIKV